MYRHQTVCERLLSDAKAGLVALIDKAGREIAQAGTVEGFNATAVAQSLDAAPASTTLAENGEYTRAFHEGDRTSFSVRTNIHVALVATGLILVVVFDMRSSLGLVRLSVKKAIEELSRSPDGGTSGPDGEGGAAAAAHVPKSYNS